MVFSEKVRIFVVVFCLTAICVGISASATEPPMLDVKAAVLINSDARTVLYGENENERQNPASTTKILTAYIILNAVNEGRYSLSDKFAADEKIYENVPNDATTANIQPGEIMSVNDYLMCALLSSANEACNALAIFHSGSIEKFAEEMNETAKKLGCNDSHFANPSGLTDENHYTTASNLATILMEAVKNPLFVEMTSTLSYTVPKTNMSRERKLSTTNRHLLESSSQYYEYTVLGKTGTTEAAGNCFVSMAKKDGATLVCVVLGAKAYNDRKGKLIIESYTETEKLYEWGFSRFSPHKVSDSSAVLKSVPVKYGQNTDAVELIAETDHEIVCTDEEFGTAYTVTTEYYDVDELVAPVSAGDSFGRITVRKCGEIETVIPIVAKEDVKLSAEGYIYFVSAKYPWAPELAAAVIILAVAIFVIVSKNKKRKEEALSAISGSHREKLDRLAKKGGVKK